MTYICDEMNKLPETFFIFSGAGRKRAPLGKDNFRDENCRWPHSRDRLSQVALCFIYKKKWWDPIGQRSVGGK